MLGDVLSRRRFVRRRFVCASGVYDMISRSMPVHDDAWCPIFQAEIGLTGTAWLAMDRYPPKFTPAFLVGVHAEQKEKISKLW